MNRGSRLICWATAILAALAPLPFGSVDPLPVAAVEVCLVALAIYWIAHRRASGLPPLPWGDPLLLAGGALLLWGLIQMTPMPRVILGAVSPAAAALRGTFVPAETGWAPLSLHPYATWRSCLWIICWSLAALMVRHNAVEPGQRRVVAGGLLAGGLFQAGYGLFEYASGRQHIFHYAKEHYTDVATGTFIGRNNYAGYLEMAIPMALAFALLGLRGAAAGEAGPGRPPGAPSLKRRLASATGEEVFVALLFVLGGFLMVGALLMSRSRMGIVSMGAALLLGGTALALRRSSRRFAVISVAMALLAVLLAAQIDLGPVVDRFRRSGDELQGGFGRFQVWTEAMPLLTAYALTGSGLGTWELAFSPFRTDTAQVRVDYAHNDYMEFAAESGMVGVLILVVGAVAALRSQSRARAAGRAPRDEIGMAAGIGLIALAMHSATDFHLSIPADAVAAAVLAGLMLRRPEEPFAAARESAERAPAARRRGGGLLPAAVCALMLLGLALAAVTPAGAQMRSTASGASPAPSTAEDAEGVDAGPLVRSAAAPDDDLCPACALEPFNGRRYVEAASRARRRLLADVEALLRAQAGGMIPDPDTRLYLARRLDAAHALALKGIELAPASGRGHLEAGLLKLGRFLLVGLPPRASRDFDEAVVELDHALSLQPWLASSHRKVARLMTPLWDVCDDRTRSFILRATRRAAALDPWAADIKEALTRIEASS